MLLVTPLLSFDGLRYLWKKTGENLSYRSQVRFLTVQGKGYTEAQLILDES